MPRAGRGRDAVSVTPKIPPGQAKPAPATPISSTFLILIVAFLGCAVWMLYRPDQARLLVFPMVLAGFLIGLCLHEFGHAIVAYHCGDTTVRDKGYLTLDPLRYTDAQYSIIFPLLIMAIGGIGLPGGAVYVNTLMLRRRGYGALVSAAGPFATAAMLVVLMIAIKAMAQPLASAPALYAALAFLALLELTALLLNLLPCPGLDGWGIIEPFLPANARRFGRRLAPLGPAILFVALFLVPGLNNWFWDLVFAASAQIGLDASAAFRGYRMFKFWS
jgi:Zn-dependent protease